MHTTFALCAVEVKGVHGGQIDICGANLRVDVRPFKPMINACLARDF
jgi:hypothetical protein